MAFKYSDNWSTTLTSSPTIGATTFTVTSVSGAPTLAAGDFTYVRIDDGGANAQNAKITGISGTTLTCTALSHAASSGNALQGAIFTTVALDQFKQDAVNAAGQAFSPGGRLTLTSGVPVTTADVTGATSVYYTPYRHNLIPLWNSTISAWVVATFTEQTLALGTVTASLPYDVFGFLSSGVLALEKLAWTNATTRSVAITQQDGRYCKSGDKTRLYLGTCYTTSTTTTEDSAANRYVFNAYNDELRTLQRLESGDWSYLVAIYRQANNSSANKVSVFAGLVGRPVSLGVMANWFLESNTVAALTAIGVNSSSTPTGAAASAMVAYGGGGIVTNTARLDYVPTAVGLFDFYWLESGADGTSSMLSDGTPFISGMTGSVRA